MSTNFTAMLSLEEFNKLVDAQIVTSLHFFFSATYVTRRPNAALLFSSGIHAFGKKKIEI